MQTLQSNTPKFWDYVILTAINEKQAQTYRTQIQHRIANQTIPNSKYLVISDTEGVVMGSGGSTLHVVSKLFDREEMFEKKVLIIHSGGFSKRLPNHACLGKIFAPLPVGKDVTMFELKLSTFAFIPQQVDGGVVMITCADDIVVFDPKSIRIECSSGVVGFAHPSPLHIGNTHGVFVVGDEGSVLRKVKKFLHKPSNEEMKNEGAVFIKDGKEMVFTDSSYFFFSDVTRKLVKFVKEHPNIDCEIDAYGDFLQPMGSNPDDSYIKKTNNVSSISKSLFDMRKALFALLKNTPFTAVCCSPSRFYHIGTMEEYLNHYNSKAFLDDINGTSTVFSVLPSDYSTKNVCIIRSIISKNVQIGENSVIEYSRISHPAGLVIGKRSILSNVDFTQEVLKFSKITFPDGMFIQTIPIQSKDRKGYVTHVFGINDDLKHAGLPSALKWFGLPILKLVTSLGLTPKDVWSTDEIENRKCSLWTAKLFPIGKTRTESLSFALQMLGIKPVTNKLVNFSTLPRESIHSTISSNDSTSILEWNAQLEQDILCEQLLALFNGEVCVTKWKDKMPILSTLYQKSLKQESENNHFTKLLQYTEDYLIEKLISQMKSVDEIALRKIRLQHSFAHLISTLIEAHSDLNNKMYQSLSQSYSSQAQLLLRDLCISYHLPMQVQLQMVTKGTALFLSNKQRSSFLKELILSIKTFEIPPLIQSIPKLKENQEVSCRLPARINLAGGWTDTPVYTFEAGGVVVNMAIKFSNKSPILAVAKVIKEPLFKFSNSEKEIKITTLKQLFTFDLEDDFALHKAVTCFCLFPQLCMLRSNCDLDWDKLLSLKDFFITHTNGFGLELSTKVEEIPKGSGLGVSSILILCCVRAIITLLKSGESKSLTHENYSGDEQREFNAVLAIEQLLTTGGGWQDQIGGAIGGIKLIETREGVYPMYSIKKVEKNMSKLNERLLVVYTGKQRLAKIVLSNVVENYMLRKEGIVETLEELKKVAHEMFENFTKLGDNHEESIYEKIGKLLTKVNELNVKLSPKSNDGILPFFKILNKFVYGSCVIGAGSGGYIVSICKENVSKQKVAKELGQSALEVCNVELCE